MAWAEAVVLRVTSAGWVFDYPGRQGLALVRAQAVASEEVPPKVGENRVAGVLERLGTASPTPDRLASAGLVPSGRADAWRCVGSAGSMKNLERSRFRLGVQGHCGGQRFDEPPTSSKAGDTRDVEAPPPPTHAGQT